MCQSIQYEYYVLKSGYNNNYSTVIILLLISECKSYNYSYYNKINLKKVLKH